MDFTFQLNYSDGRQNTLHVTDRSNIDPATLNSSEKGRPWTRLNHPQDKKSGKPALFAQAIFSMKDRNGIVSSTKPPFLPEQIVL